MSKSDAGHDYDRYRKLLAEADDESKRMAFINLLIEEKAKDKLAGQALRDRLSRLGLKSFPGVDEPRAVEPTAIEPKAIEPAIEPKADESGQ